MKSKNILLLLTIIFWSSCVQPPSNDQRSNDHTNLPEINFKSGLKIKNRINRGTNYTDSLGVNYSIRNIPISITNDTTISIHLKIEFSKEYNYPYPDNNEKFRLIPLPKEWALDGIGVTQNMIDELPKHIETPLLNVTIKPGEVFLFSIGSLYPRPARTSGVLPRTLFVSTDTTTFPECEWLIPNDQSSNQPLSIKLKIVTGERCTIIPCGSIAYSY